MTSPASAYQNDQLAEAAGSWRRSLGDGGVAVDEADKGESVLGGAGDGEVGLQGGQAGGGVASHPRWMARPQGERSTATTTPTVVEQSGSGSAPPPGARPPGSRQAGPTQRQCAQGAQRTVPPAPSGPAGPPAGAGAGRPVIGRGVRHRLSARPSGPPASGPGPAHAGRTGLGAMATTSVTPVGAGRARRRRRRRRRDAAVAAGQQVAAGVGGGGDARRCRRPSPRAREGSRCSRRHRRRRPRHRSRPSSSRRPLAVGVIPVTIVRCGPQAGQRADEAGVAEGEDPAVGADHPVAPAVGGGHDAHDVADVDRRGPAASRRSRRRRRRRLRRRRRPSSSPGRRRWPPSPRCC